MELPDRIKNMYSHLIWRDKKWTLWGSTSCGLIYKEPIEEVRNNENLEAFASIGDNGIFMADGEWLGTLREKTKFVPKPPKKVKMYADYLRDGK